MAFNATAIPVMIASPSDVSEEREIIRSVLNEWNNINASTRKIILLPVGWETHSSPDLSGRPQEIINKRVLKDCDLLIGVFWTRIGTPTGVEVSGTVEEIKEHSSLNKPVMLYFSDKPISPDSIVHEQYNALKNFKNWCKEKGLIESYSDIEEFKSKIRRQLEISLNENDYLKVLYQENHLVSDIDQIIDIHKPRLTEDAISLLTEAAKDEVGHIINLRHMGGTNITAGQKEFVVENSRREIAKWEDAITNLQAYEMIKDVNGKGQIFEVTNKGFNYLDGSSV